MTSIYSRISVDVYNTMWEGQKQSNFLILSFIDDPKSVKGSKSAKKNVNGAMTTHLFFLIDAVRKADAAVQLRSGDVTLLWDGIGWSGVTCIIIKEKSTSILCH